MDHERRHGLSRSRLPITHHYSPLIPHRPGLKRGQQITAQPMCELDWAWSLASPLSSPEVCPLSITLNTQHSTPKAGHLHFSPTVPSISKLNPPTQGPSLLPKAWSQVHLPASRSLPRPPLRPRKYAAPNYRAASPTSVRMHLRGFN